MMRGTRGMRLALGLLSPAFLLLCLVAIWAEDRRPWAKYAEEFSGLYRTKAAAKLKEAQGKRDAKQAARWQRVENEIANQEPEIMQVSVEELKVADRCTTCHRGIDNTLFKDAPEPFGTHPGDYLRNHEVSRFGCTPCHQGQGVATTEEGAHGKEPNWPFPMLPGRYVEASCAGCHEVTHGLKGAEVATRGADLFLEKGCYGCHGVKGEKYRYLPKYAPPLGSLKSKLKEPERWVYAWIKDPTHFNRKTAMPSFKLTDEEARKIAAYLLTLPADTPPPAVSLENASAEQGEKLFTERGCHGCHGVKEDEESVSSRVPNLAGIASKVTAEWLDRWIADPKAYNPDTPMPKVELNDAERHAVVAYLLTLKRDEELPAAPDLSRVNAKDGKQLVRQYECYGCHAIKGFEKVRPSVPDLGDFARKRLDELDFGMVKDAERTKWGWLERKLKEPRAFETEKIKLRMPQIAVTEDEQRALVTYVLAFDVHPPSARYTVPVTPAKQALRELSWMVARLNCNGCHPLGDKEPHIARFFERKNMLPPTLNGIGARLQGPYLYQFLMEPKKVRPWLTLRMPAFGFTEPQAQLLAEGFAAAANVTSPYTYVAQASIPQDHLQRGVRRFAHYKCIQCHPTSIDQGLPKDVDPEDLSINLTLAKTRLRPDWIKEFLARPKQIVGTQTRMPTVFYTVDGVEKVADPEKDIDDITTYLMAMTQPPEALLKAEEAARKKEEAKEKEVDWMKMQY